MVGPHARTAQIQTTTDRGAPPPHDAHHPSPRSIPRHLYQYNRPPMSLGGLFKAERLGVRVKKVKVRVVQPAPTTAYFTQQPTTPPPHHAHHPNPRSFHAHLRRHSRPEVSLRGLSADSRLQRGRGGRHSEEYGLHGSVVVQAGVGPPNSEGWCQQRSRTSISGHVVAERGGSVGV